MDLRLMAITDAALAAPRDVLDVVRRCLQAGAPAVQLRDKTANARKLLADALLLRELTAEYGALLIVNDRLDVALAAGADGVHLGPADLPVSAARQVAPPPFIIGCSTDDPQIARRAEREGASYIGCGAVFGTTSKAEVRGERIGVARLAEVVRAVSLPVLAIGGVCQDNVAELERSGAAGAAVIGALMKADEPDAATHALLNKINRWQGRGT